MSGSGEIDENEKIRPVDVVLYRSNVPGFVKAIVTLIWAVVIATATATGLWWKMDGRVEAAENNAAAAKTAAETAVKENKEAIEAVDGKVQAVAETVGEIGKQQQRIVDRLDRAEKDQDRFRQETKESLDTILGALLRSGGGR